LAAWEMLCKPKDKGGVGIVNFTKRNEALLLKHLDNFFNKADLPWVHLIWHSYYGDSVPHAQKLCGSFWWWDVCKHMDGYMNVASVLPGKGDSFLFWSDKWLFDGSTGPLAESFPRLYSYVLDSKLTTAEVYDYQQPSELFHLPMSEQAYQEFQLLTNLMRFNPLLVSNDKWVYSWGPTYTVSKYYQHLHAHIVVMPIFKWIWKSACMMRTKFFAWLLLNDRVNTRDMLISRHWNVTNDNHCVLCPSRAYEDSLHMFFNCNFSQRVWNYLQIDRSQGQDIQAAAFAARKDFGKPFFMEVVIIALWNIWKQRNGQIF
jgi:hypothetical protein